LRDKKLSFSFQKPFDFISLRNSVVFNSSGKDLPLSLGAEGTAARFWFH